VKAPAFWWRERRGLAAHVLAPAGWAVGAVATRRMNRAPAVRLPVPVVVVGNPTVGGAGKTPVAIAVAEALAAAGARPVFLTRGYRGRRAGPLVVSPQNHTADEVGDEPLLLAARHPTVVSRERGVGGRLAATLGDVVVMDDGFQNPALARDFASLLVDAAAGLGNRAVTPAGPLRAPFAAHLAHADAVVLVDAGEGREAAVPAVPCEVHRARLVVSCEQNLAGVDVLAFAGIGRPQKFFAGLATLGAAVRQARAFADHARYGEDAAAALLARAERGGLLPATTRKDAVRLAAGGPSARALLAAAVIVDVRAELDAALVAAILARVGGGGTDAAPARTQSPLRPGGIT